MKIRHRNVWLNHTSDEKIALLHFITADGWTDLTEAELVPVGSEN